MKKLVKTFLENEVILYLIAGVAATLVYIITRTSLFYIWPNILMVTLIANTVAILFAFWTNDRYVFKQERNGWQGRLVKFIGARTSTLVLDMALAYFLVEKFPHIIGQFVQQDIQKVNAIATALSQVLVIVLNYVLSKLFIFKNTK
ncbi:GtrA family protein [Streptococcus suis]|nr:GtrA family protein [Streptococcus suis]